ncbi:MAG: thiamine pyrophosphate-dependent enzyme [Candidatus Moduliflexus flocculans]|nr:thiamine pyrophosphate-dependent enzyme [Candidatus Moduliflexus flocculans]
MACPGTASTATTCSRSTRPCGSPSEQIRSGKGRCCVETLTYRYFGHSKSDRNLYRTKEEIEDWREQPRPDQALPQPTWWKPDLLTEKQAEEIDQEALQVIEAAVAFAEAAPDPDPSTVMEYRLCLRSPTSKPSARRSGRK